MLTQIGRRDSTTQAFFRYRQISEDQIVVTNTEGSYLVLSKGEFQDFSTSAVAEGSPLHSRLTKRNFLKKGYDSAAAVERIRKRKMFLGTGPNLHIFVVTLRCNQTCIYCHSSRATMDAVGTDMPVEVAEKSVDLALQSTSPAITIEFQGGEPLVNFPVVRRILDYALERNKAVGKTLDFTLVSNLSLMDEEKLKYLLDRKVQICTSIDGPAVMHDRQRKLPNASAHQVATHWIRRINEAYVEMGLDPSVYHVEALLTTTRETLGVWKEVVDTYVSLGCRALFLRPLDPFGFADRTTGRIEYPRRDYLDFYETAVDYMIELNKQGVQILERFAGIFLTKILGGEDPNYLDIRSPCGAGIGQLAYNHDGAVFTCDEGRMLSEMGDDTFRIGDVRTSTYRDLMGHDTVRALAMASNLDAQPDCVNCAYNPYCGVCPVHNHKTQGDLWGRMRESSLCSTHKGIQDYLFRKIGEGDPEVMDIFRRWTTVRDRSHFVQAASA